MSLHSEEEVMMVSEHSASRALRNMGLVGLEKPSKIIQSHHPPNPTVAIKACPQVP